MSNFNAGGRTGLSTLNAIECNPLFLSEYEFLVMYTTLIQIYMKIVEIYQLQCKRVYRIKQAKCYRMSSTIPVRLWILSDVYYFNPKIHENSGNTSISMKVGSSD